MDTSVETFHYNCKMTWNSNYCPVCSYIKNPDLIKHLECMKCDTKDSLWFCIICGHIGCGHEVQHHGLKHYMETGHRYAMGLLESKVWDYKIRKFVHQMDDTEQIVSSHTISTQTTTGNNCSCAVCQHNLSPKFLKKPVCMTCEECEAQNLWICMSCHHIGCSRHRKRHALKHYLNTKHPHVMQLANFSIWDYNEKKYLHGQVRYCVAVRLQHGSHEGSQ